MLLRRVFFTAALAFLVLYTTSCDSGEDDFPLTGTNLSMSEIAGSWTATRALFLAAGTGPALAVDVVAIGGSATLTIQNSGRFSLTITRPGGAAEVTNGQLGFDEDLLVVAYDDDPDDYELFGIRATATTLSINGPGTFDFEGNGTEVAVTIELDFVRS